MSSAERAASLIMKIDQRELRILQGIELGMAQYEFVPINIVGKFSGMSGDELKYWLKELDKKELILRQSEGYTGFILNYNSYDLLALNALVKGEIIDALGMPLGMGKEADVLEALTPVGEGVAVKFHRLGRISFRDTRRKREYLAGRRHISWLYQSRLAAEKEYTALTLANKAGVSVPEPIHQNRHVIVMQRIEGRQLSEIASLDDPEGLLDKILENIHKAYKASLIHADLSEFNVIVSESGFVYIIDWPQYIHSNHPNADEILERDVNNILTYFSRKFRVKRNREEALCAVKALR
jgi:RIO kinase 2